MRPDATIRFSAWEAGFSLVELLVGLVLLSMVAALLASGLSLGQKVWQRSEERAQAARVMFDVETALRRLVDNIQPLRLSPQDNRAIDFRGSADGLEGIVPLPPNIGLGGLYRFHLFRNRSVGRLDISFRAYEPGKEAVDDGTNLTTLATDVDGMELRYFGKTKGEETPTWRNEWRGQEELPALVSIKITGARAGVVWPELLIASRVKAVDWR